MGVDTGGGVASLLADSSDAVSSGEISFDRCQLEADGSVPEYQILSAVFDCGNAEENEGGRSCLANLGEDSGDTPLIATTVLRLATGQHGLLS